MLKRIIKLSPIILSTFFFVAILGSCRSYKHTSDFEMQSQIKEKYDTLPSKPYITSTMPIDSADPSKVVVDIYRIETDEYPKKIKLYARVFDSAGHFLTNMASPYILDKSKNYWNAFDEKLGEITKRPEHIKSFNVREYGAGDSIPYNIALTIDYSGSMTGVLNTIFEGTELFVGMKQSYDKIAVASFTKEYNLQVPLTKENDKIINIFRSKRSEDMGKTYGVYSSVYDAMMNSINIFAQTDTVTPRVLVIFTDGDDNYSKTEIGDLIDKAKEQKIHIFTIGFGYSKDDNLKTIAQYTGGRFYKAYTKEELIAVFRDIYMSLRYYYLIDYVPPRYWGYHKVISTVLMPSRKDTIFGYGEYDTRDVNIKVRDSGIVFTRPILFDFSKFDLKPESKPIIEEVAELLNAYPKMKLEIQGHTDNVGGVELNQTLSENRAKTVMDALIATGIEAKRLRSRGFGLSMPVAPNETDEGRAKNRRTEFHILAK